MSLVNYNLDVIQGSTFSAQLFAKDANGAAINLSGYNVRGVVKYNYGTGVSLVSLNPAVNTGQSPPLATYTAESGVIDVGISAANTSTLPITVGVYDIEMYNNDETEVKKLLDGRVRVHPEVTNI
tara:strand:- start:341 stop:715 length:375 start_codon:yes stop_codon:yes gene_type:complete